MDKAKLSLEGDALLVGLIAFAVLGGWYGHSMGVRHGIAQEHGRWVDQYVSIRKEYDALTAQEQTQFERPSPAQEDRMLWISTKLYKVDQELEAFPPDIVRDGNAKYYDHY